MQELFSKQENFNSSENRTFDKVKVEFSLLKQSIHHLDRKLDDEISFRLKSEDEIKMWFDQKFLLYKESANSEEILLQEKEKRLQNFLQEGLSRIGDILKEVKEKQSSQIKDVSDQTFSSI